MTEEFFFILGPIFLILILFVIEKTRQLLLNNISESLVFLSGFFFLLADLKNDNLKLVILNLNWKQLNTALIIFGVISAIISIFISAREKKGIINKDKSKLKSEYYKFCSDFIRNTFETFFQNSSRNGRVSIYLHKNNKFILIGRYSNNPNYTTKGRKDYPDNKGLISKGWEDEICELYGIPEWRGLGQQYHTKVRRVKEIDIEVVKNLKMKSRSFYIKRIDNEDSRTPHGIIVIEQMKSNQINSDILNDIFEKNTQNLVLLFKGLNSITKN
jgi:hypothetical protein